MYIVQKLEALNRYILFSNPTPQKKPHANKMPAKVADHYGPVYCDIAVTIKAVNVFKIAS